MSAVSVMAGLLPAEMEEYIRFFHRQNLLKQCHDEMKVKVDLGLEEEGGWVYKEDTRGRWRRSPAWDSKVGWGREWSTGNAREVRVDNVGHKRSRLFRNIPVQLMMAWNFSYKYIERKEVEMISGVEDINKTQDWVAV